MFKDNLKALRKNKGYSMDELCKIYNDRYNGKMNKSTLSRYENGLQEPMFTVVRNLSELFNVTVEELTNNSSTTKKTSEPAETDPLAEFMLSPKQRELLEILLTLDQTELDKALDYAQYLLSQRGKRG